MRRFIFRIGIVATAAAFFLGTGAARTAYAYPIATGTDTGTTGSLNNIIDPFENFFKSIDSVSIGIPAAKVPVAADHANNNGGGNAVAGWIQKTFQQFDAWLYGKTGFRISGLLTAVLGMFSWLLGFVKRGVDWLLTVVH